MVNDVNSYAVTGCSSQEMDPVQCLLINNKRRLRLLSAQITPLFSFFFKDETTECACGFKVLSQSEANIIPLDY